MSKLLGEYERLPEVGLLQILSAPCLEAQKRFENVIDTQRLLEEHHKQLLRAGFFRNKHYIPETEECHVNGALAHRAITVGRLRADVSGSLSAPTVAAVGALPAGASDICRTAAAGAVHGAGARSRLRGVFAPGLSAGKAYGEGCGGKEQKFKQSKHQNSPFPAAGSQTPLLYS